MNTFPNITYISDVQSKLSNKPEIRFMVQPNGITVACYMFADSDTFDSPEALECRGIAFDASGKIVSRPLHKFFNVGEKPFTQLDQILKNEADIVAIYEKLDGSMIATCDVGGKDEWRSKKAFHSEVVNLTKEYVKSHPNIEAFAQECVNRGCTAIFELTHPSAQIVVTQREPKMRLLHVRDNVTGEYLLLDRTHEIHTLVEQHKIECVVRFYEVWVSDLIESLPNMTQQEGYIIQFASGDMVKLKCPWYLRLHHSITFLRERDIALLALNEELDGVKGSLIEAGIDLTEVNAVESRLKQILINISDTVESVHECDKNLSRKDFALKYKGHELFSLLMIRYAGQEVNIAHWYEKTKLKEDFGLRQLVSSAVSEALEG